MHDHQHPHEHDEPDHVHTEVQINLDEISHWLEHGVRQGWIGPPMCHTHDGAPPENEQLHGCALYVRIYKTVDEQDWVEKNHQNTREFLRRFEHD